MYGTNLLDIPDRNNKLCLELKEDKPYSALDHYTSNRFLITHYFKLATKRLNEPSS